jgi:hypothetical protein
MYCIAMVENLVFGHQMTVEQNSMPLGAVTVCGVQNLISSRLTYPAHRQGKHKVMAKNLNLKEK